MSDLKKALLIQTAFIGDVILTTPMIAAFKHFFPDASLTVLVKPEAVALLSENPAVDEVLVIDKKRNHRGPAGMLRMAREIRSRHFDILLSPHQSHRTSLLAMFSRIPERYGYGSAGFARLAYTHRLRRNTQRIEIDRLLDFLADALRVNTVECPRDLKIFVNDSARQEARQLLRDLDVRRPILLGPSSVWPTKRWTAWGFARLANDLIRRYRSPVLLVGAPGDCEINDRVQRWVRLLYPPYIQERVFNVAGRTSLPGLYALMEQSLLLVSNDSAPVHFGCAAGLPLVSIFGPTAPSLGYAPVAPRTAVAELSDLHCRPCSTHGGRECPQQHFRCMRDMEPEMILRHLERLVST